MMDWDDIRLALAIAEAGSMTAAARGLGLSQPTLGRRLRDLEATLGGKLFERFPNHLATTPFGLEVLQQARAMQEAALDIARLADHRRAEGDEVRISATTSVGLYLSSRMDRLALPSDRPSISVALSITRATVDLGRREADIALRMRALPESGRIRASRIGRLCFTLYELAGSAPEGLNGRSYIGLTDDRPPPQKAWLDRHAEETGGRIPYRLGEVFLRHRAVLDGLGVSLLPCFIGDGDARLTRLIAPPPELDEDVYLLLHEDVAPDGSVHLLADRLQHMIREDDALLTGRPARDPA